jgi:uncharacterized membrane protein YtjA (UPF0391 family)
MGVVAFLLAFTSLAGGAAGGGVVLYLLAAALLVTSFVIFLKCKPLEEVEE